MKPPLVIVAAVARNGIIGGDNRLLWKLPSDLKHFRAVTTGKPLVMGRKTFESIGRPLPGRQTIVVTRDTGWRHDGVATAASLPTALELARETASQMGADEIVIAGGAELYRQTINLADRMRITEVDCAPSGDASFPSIDPARWRETQRETPEPGPSDECSFSFVDYETS